MKTILSGLRFLVILSLLTTCASSDGPIQKISCHTCGTEISVDGFADEWGDIRSSIINDDTYFGVCRNGNDLFVHLLTSDPEIVMQIMNFGLTTWLDERGMQKKLLGVQFPVVQMVPPPPRDAQPPTGEALQRFLNERLGRIALVTSEKGTGKIMTIEEAGAEGIEANIGIDGNMLSLELKYPLNPAPEPVLNICIETPEIDFHEMMQGQEGNIMPPGMEERQGNQPPPGNQPRPGDQPPPGTQPRPGEQPPAGNQPPPQAGKLTDVSNQTIRPRPPQITRISHWMEIVF